MWKVFPCHGFIIVHWHDDVIKWKHFPRYWPFVRGNHQPTINSPHKGQWCGALMFSLISVWTNGWVNNREPGDMRRYRAHCDVTVMCVNFTFRRWQLPPYYTTVGMLEQTQYIGTSWWRQQMEIFSASLALCEGNLRPPVVPFAKAGLWWFLWSPHAQRVK